MKSIKLTLLFLAIACISLSCKKGGGEEESDCEEDYTTKVTYTNTGSTKLRVQVANSLTAQFVPIDPVVTLDLNPGQSVGKVIPAGKYFSVWSSNCPANCSMNTYYNKTYAPCGDYKEELGL